MCISNPIRPVYKARTLLKKMHQLCIKNKLELGQVAPEEVSGPTEEENGVATGGQAEAPIVGAGADAALVDDSANGNWKGTCVWMVLGKAPSQSEPREGLATLQGRSVTFDDVD